MSKLIKLPQDILDQYTKEFYETLRSGKFSDGKVNFTKTLGTVDRKATVLFTELAWQKMQLLVKEFDKEVAWHGIAERCEEKDTYLISDILVYPQEVTGSTVTTDQSKYENWLMSHDDDVFNNIRMQGHSHVNMAVSPSSVDLSLYERILDQLGSDMFYIFMIKNATGNYNRDFTSKFLFVLSYDLNNIFYLLLILFCRNCCNVLFFESKMTSRLRTFYNNKVGCPAVLLFPLAKYDLRRFDR